MSRTQTIEWGTFSRKHKQYIRKGVRSAFCVAEGAVRSGKTIDHCIIAAAYLERSADKYHLASGSTIGNAKLNIGVCNGFGLENLFRGRCKWGKYRDNEALFIQTQTGEKVVIFTGGGKADSYKRILGNSYGLWIATEINEHYDCDDSRTSFLKVAMARQAAAAEPLRLWDLNPSSPADEIYSRYIDKYREDEMPGYLYEHFTIYDNASITDEQRQAFVALYDPTSVWYRRDILGERVTAEGLIYRAFADDPKRWALTKDQLRERWYDERRQVWKFADINLGVDFGGNGSAHAFNCTALTPDDQLVTLMTERINAKDMPVQRLTEAFLAFGDRVLAEYGRIDVAYCDSAEQTIIATFREAAPFPIANSAKNEIKDRIRAMDLMLSTDRWHYVDGSCDSLVGALSTAVWDKDKAAWVRLDNGSTDIDSLDAFEYSWERYIRALVPELRRKNEHF